MVLFVDLGIAVGVEALKRTGNKVVDMDIPVEVFKRTGNKLGTAVVALKCTGNKVNL